MSRRPIIAPPWRSITMTGYRNPVIPGFQPDPSVCRVGDEFFLATSSFTYFPGVPIFRSTNLVEWEQIGNVLDRVSQLDLTGTGSFPSSGVCAPTLRHHDGRYWMITTVVSPDRERVLDNFFVTADEPGGPWSDPVPVDLPGIDPDLAWDDEGNCWAHFALGAIQRCRIDDGTGEVLDGPEPTWSGTGLQFPEAPHLLRRDGTWYLLIAEGGTERGHAVSIARGPAPTGPWESCPANPILTHRSTDRPIQATGHADLVEAADGSWWMVLLGTRPTGTTPMFHVLGRETFLAPVEWVDGWPVVADLVLEMSVQPPRAATGERSRQRDDFNDPAPAPAWVGVRVPLGEAQSLSDRPGWLTLHGADGGLDHPYPVFVGQRQADPVCVARTLLDPGGAREAGLAVRMDEHHHYEVFVADGDVVARARIGPVADVVARRPLPAPETILRIETVTDASEPDRVHLGFESADGTFEVLADLPGRYLSTEVAGGFTGRVIGVYAVGGSAAFDWFELGPLVVG